MSKYQAFIFKDYTFDRLTGRLELSYSYNHVLDFHESYRFDFKFVDYDEVALERALQLLFFMAGVSYYKAFLAPEIVVEKGAVDEQLAAFLGQTYQKGLGEFFYVNELDPHTPVVFPINSHPLTSIEVTPSRGTLVGVGGGKDSLVSVELLRKAKIDFSTWSLNHRPQLTPLVKRIDTKHLWVDREWDAQLLDLKENPDAYNGHVPISAIFACVGTVVAILSGKRDAIVSNENSANEPTLHYKGVATNHQYSKSLEFEKAYQAVLRHCFGDSVRYFSFLRPLSEVRIAELFAGLGFEKYKAVFSSCNRAFVHGSREMSWDGACPKCAFVFLALTPFVERSKLEALFSGKNLLLDPELEPTYKQLLGIDGDKPLECVGEIKESRAAMRLAQAKYPELAKYQFELPADYDFQAWSESAMPAELLSVLRQEAGNVAKSGARPKTRLPKKSKRRKRLIIGTGLLIVVFIAGKLVLSAVDQPATAAVQVGKATVAGYDIDLTPVAEVGKTVSFDYPAGLKLDKSTPASGPIIEQLNYRVQDVESWLLAVSVSNLPDSELDQSASYTYRKDNPAIYQESHEVVNGQAIDLMTNTAVGGFNKAAYIVHGGLIGIVSLVGDDSSGTQPLQTTFNMVLQSWHWQ